MTQAQLLHRLPAPRRDLARAWRWCVDGGGALTAAFDARGRVALVVTTAPGHAAGRVHPKARARGLRSTRRRVLGVRHGRVAFVAVATPTTTADPRALRGYLRAAGYSTRVHG